MQYDTNATWYITIWLSYHGLYIKQSMYIHQRKHGMIHMVRKNKKIINPPRINWKGQETPSPPRKHTNVAWSRGFVKMSASWSWVRTWLNTMVPFSTLSLKKWYLTSTCLVLEWSTWFFATLMALVLSQRSGIWVYSSPKSLKMYEIHNTWEQQLATATYSASVVDWATLDCLREGHETNEDPRNWQVPEVDFLSTRQPAKSASEKSWREGVEEDEYQRTRSGADCSVNTKI
jgi:hypothetical protein